MTEEIRKQVEKIMLASTPEDVSYHADKIISLMQAEHEKENIFINHIQGHLDAMKIQGDVICKICNKSVSQIYQEEGKQLILEHQALSEKIDRVVDEWWKEQQTSAYGDLTEELKQKLREAVKG